MKAQKWISGLCLTLLLPSMGIVSAAENVDITQSQNKYNLDRENVVAAKEYAVALARNQNFTASLEILKQLYEKYPDNKDVLFDYIVVLNWAGNNKAAIELYEKNPKSNVPIYVKSSMAGAYYQIGDYQTARKLFHEAAATGDHQAKLGEAQSSIRVGETEAAAKLYKALLAANPTDIEVYLSRASMSMMDSQYAAAVADYQTVLTLLPEGDAGRAQRRKINYDMAVAYIRLGEEGQAVLTLKPYIDDGTADIWMQGDYVSALRSNADYKTAIREGERLWPNYSKLPTFALQSLGDSYLRDAQTAKAVTVYKFILVREPNSTPAKLGLAYAYMSQGKTQQGLAIYKQLIQQNPKLAAVILDDAYDFVAKKHYATGKMIYSLIVDQFPGEAVFREEMAVALADNEMPRQAYEQYDFLAKLPDGQLVGNAGMGDTAIIVGDYQSAGAAIGVLKEKYSRSAISQGVVSSYESRERGGVEAAYIDYSDYRGIKSRQSLISATQTIGGSYSILASLSDSRLTDKTIPKTATLTSRSVGLGYTGMKYEGKIWLDNYNSFGTFNGYHFFNNYYFDDHAVVNFDFGRTPVSYAGALDPSDSFNTFYAGALDPNNAENAGRIMANNYTLGFKRQIGMKTNLQFNATLGLYSDGNQVHSLEAGYVRNLLDSESKRLDWFISASRSTFKYQVINGADTVYESPSSRYLAGPGLTERWEIPQGYWEGTLAFDFGTDRPDPLEFEPSARLEYGHNFSPSSSLMAVIEYGARTNRANGNNSIGHFGSRQYELHYLSNW